MVVMNKQLGSLTINHSTKVQSVLAALFPCAADRNDLYWRLHFQCPGDFTNSSLIASDPGYNAGFVIYYALQGAVFPPC